MKTVPVTDGILESSLYVEDVGRAVRFYEEIFGFRVIAEFGERGCAMRAEMREKNRVNVPTCEVGTWGTPGGSLKS